MEPSWRKTAGMWAVCVHAVYSYLRSFVGDRIIYESDKTKSELSDAISRDLISRGMSFVGSTVIYSYLQAVGFIYSHEPECFLYKSGE